MDSTCCIFDLDGVICDTAQFHFIAWQALAQELGIDFTLQDNERLKGVSRMDSLEILLSLKKGGTNFSQEQKLELAARKNALYLTYIEALTPEALLPGVKDFILELRGNGIKVCLGSVSKNAPLILRGLGITALFDVIVDGNVVTRAKPAPDVFLESSRSLGIDTASCVVFEDAIAGVEAAHAAGMKCVGVGDAAVLYQADAVIPGFAGFDCRKLQSLL